MLSFIESFIKMVHGWMCLSKTHILFFLFFGTVDGLILNKFVPSERHWFESQLLCCWTGKQCRTESADTGHQ